MKAAVLKTLGSIPVYEEFQDPQSNSKEHLIMQVKAAALKNIDKALAGGKHYASYKEVPVVVGLDGAGTLPDGTRVYAQGVTGTLAAQALIAKGNYTILPDNIDWFSAAALPNAAMGSYLPLRVKGEMKPGDHILINGGTGITGKLAIQLARYYGASNITVMGHTEGKEETLKALGADHIISTTQPDKEILEQLEHLNNTHPIQLVIDYLWGHPTELIINGLAGRGGNYPRQFTKIVTVGALSGDEIALSSNTMRSGKTAIVGAGLGSYRKTEFNDFHQKVLPELFRLAAEGTLTMDIQQERLADISAVWNKKADGKRIVIAI